MSSRLATCTATLALVASLATTASAQIEKGDSQISVNGSLSQVISSNGSGGTSGSLGGAYGYFLTRQLAIRGSAFITASGGGGVDEFGNPSSETTFLGAYGAGMELNLTGAGQKFVPYLAFDVLTLTGQNSEMSTTMFGPSVGARAFVSRSTAFDMSMRYETTSTDTSTGTLRTNFGFAVFFGGNRK